MSDTWGMYLATAGVLLLIYIAARTSFWADHRLPEIKSDDRPGTAIDTSPLTDRLAQVKDDYSGKLPADHSSFKKPLLLQQRRQELAQLPFFQPPVEPEEPGKHDGFTLVLV